MKPEYDAVVVGAGVAGCMAATALGLKGADLRVLLIDRNPRTQPGKKTTQGWICGDAVAEHHAKFVQRELGTTFGSPEIENHVNSIVVCSPDRGVAVPMEGAGYVLDRPKFARRLLKGALKTGIEYRHSTQAVELLDDGKSVTGIVCKEQRGKRVRPYKVTSKLVIDCSGMSTTLRRDLRIPSFIEKEIDRDDVEPTIRLIARLARGSRVDTSRCEIYLDAERAPGGYLWMFPKGPDKVNIGLGIQQRRTRDPLQTLLERWVTETPIFREMSVLSEDGNKSGAWPVSVRHQNDSLVANGFMLAGDSGWFPNPISAGGIGPAMTGGVIAGRVAVSALQAKDASEQNLWSYNTAYVDEYGRKTAALETFRIYLQTLDNSELDYGLRNFVSQEEASRFTLGEIPELGFANRIMKVARGLRKFSAFRGLAFSISKMSELNRLYEEYPRSPRDFSRWKRRVDSILTEVRSKFR